MIFVEYARELAHGISVSSGGALLEVAADTGLATRQIRDKVAADVGLVVTDLNADMLGIIPLILLACPMVITILI